MPQNPSRRKGLARITTQALFGGLLTLLLVAAVVQSNLENAQTLQHFQIGLIIVMMIFGLFEIRRTQRRLQQLGAVAKTIGEGQLDARVEDDGRDALGHLGREINHMAERIQSAIREWDQSQRELANSREELSRQHEQLSAAYARQSQFRDFLADLTAIDINTLASKALEHVITAANAHLGVFFLHDPESKKLACLSSRGPDRRALSHLCEDRAMDGLPGEVFARQKWIFVDDIALEALPEIDLGIVQAKIQCVYGVPVTFRGSVLGVLILGALNRPDASTVELLMNHVDALANGLNNALSYKALNRQSVALERANRELRKADRLRSEFVANMSHELRTPLNSIIGFSGILMKNRSGNLGEAELKRVEKINRNGKNLLGLINDILDLSKVEAGRMELSRARFSVNALVSEVVELLQPQADQKKIALQPEVPKESVDVVGDEQKLRQVLVNLVGNAVKFTREGSVRVRVEPSSTDALIHVIDTGIGIPGEKLETIFEAFRQADNSTTREFGGTGLGLTISRSMLELMGGELAVSSEVGKGSVFSVRLPTRLELGRNLPAAAGASRALGAAGEGASSAHAPASAGEAKPGATLMAEIRSTLSKSIAVKPGNRVLVVDDDADARELIKQHLEDVGATALLCARAEDTVSIAAKERPNLITLDIMMPGRNGWEVLSALKSDPATRDIPVVIVSIVADQGQAISLGAVDALTKPITRMEFNETLERNLRSEGRQRAKVLVVEDDSDTRQLMIDWLSPNVEVLETANNGKEALEALESFTPDVILLDLQMPVMDGFVFLRRLREDPRHEELPVIVVTARALGAMERRDLERQASRVLLKGELFAE